MGVGVGGGGDVGGNVGHPAGLYIRVRVWGVIQKGVIS